MNDNELLTQVRQLENEVEQLKAQVQLINSMTKIASNISQRILRFLVSNWVLLSFLIAIMGAIVVWIGFGIDPFEDDRNIQTSKNLSEFYQAWGDELFNREEWKEAEAAYQTSVDINPHNAAATYGIAKAQVLQPPDGEQFISPGSASVNIAYLTKYFPKDYQTDFLNGMRATYMNDDQNAILWFNQSLAGKENFASYESLGEVYVRDSKLIEAINSYQNALRLDPDNAQAHGNLAYAYMFKKQFYLAASHFQTAEALSATMDTELGMGEAYRYQHDFDYALTIHQFTLARLSEPGIETQDYAAGEYLYYYLPLSDDGDDTWTTRNSVVVWRFQDKQMFLHFELSFDYALTGDFKNAESEFNKAYQLNPTSEYKNFFANTIRSIEGYTTLDTDETMWFNQQFHRLLA